ncbi:MAG: DUF3108 domain-containing protein [Gammaproteobacteria bacterium]|nr:DUF3108 domain-containing protein [Gammaproteobacteria bacterium]
MRVGYTAIAKNITTHMNHLKHPGQIVIQFILAITVTLLGKSALAFEIDSQTLRYSVEYAKQNAGELEVVIQHNTDQVSITTISHLSLLARMFLTAQTSTSVFNLNDGNVELEKGQDYLKKDGSLVHSFTIDQGTQTIKFLNGETVSMDPSHLLDADSFPIGLMSSEIEMLKGKIVRVVSGKRTRLYRYRAPQQETVDTRRGKAETWKVTRERLDNPESTVTFWLDRENGLLPIKIITSKKGRNTLLTLTQ